MERNVLRYKPVSAVIFEPDGVIFNSGPAQRYSIVSCFLRRGHVISKNLIKEISGLTHTDAVKLLMKETEVDAPFSKIYYEADRRYRNLTNSIELQPGAQTLLEHLHANGIPLAICSNSTPELLDLKLRSNTFQDYFQHKTVYGSPSQENVNGKPEPNLYKNLIPKFGNLSPRKILAFESTIHGMNAALAAGLQVVMVPDDFLDDPDATRPATVAIRTLNGFIPEDFGLPPYCKCGF